MKKIYWPKAKDRPKTLYLKEGFRRLGYEIYETNALLKKFQPPSNSRGPYVYPFILQTPYFKTTVLYDIGTNPDLFHINPNRHPETPYFKIHIRKRHPALKLPNVHVAPNSPSRMEFLDLLPELRKRKDQWFYAWDYFFCGWHDDRGLRMKCVKEFKKHEEWNGLAGLQPFKHHTKVPPHLFAERMLYENHLMNQAVSKLNLALAGGFALPWTSFRHVELWGMGAAMLTVSPDCVLPGNPKSCWVEFKRNMSDFETKVNFFLRDNESREMIARNGREYFDKYLLPEKHAEYFISKIKKRMGKA